MANIPEQINTACDVRTCHDVTCKKREGEKGGRRREMKREGKQIHETKTRLRLLAILKNPDIRNVGAMRNTRKSDKSQFHPHDGRIFARCRNSGYWILLKQHFRPRWRPALTRHRSSRSLARARARVVTSDCRRVRDVSRYSGGSWVRELLYDVPLKIWAKHTKRN